MHYICVPLMGGDLPHCAVRSDQRYSWRWLVLDAAC
jgi:hypothetical protein